MPDNSEGIFTFEKIGFFFSAIALLMAIITASELAATSQKCELKPKGPAKWMSK